MQAANIQSPNKGKPVEQRDRSASRAMRESDKQRYECEPAHKGNDIGSRDNNCENNELKQNSANKSTPFSVASLLSCASESGSENIQVDGNIQGSNQAQDRGIPNTNENTEINLPVQPSYPTFSSECIIIPSSRSQTLNENKQYPQTMSQTHTQQLSNKVINENTTREDIHDKQVKNSSVIKSRPDSRAGKAQCFGKVESMRHHRSQSLGGTRRKDGYPFNVDAGPYFDFATEMCSQDKLANSAKSPVCSAKNNRSGADARKSKSVPNESKQSGSFADGNVSRDNVDTQQSESSGNALNGNPAPQGETRDGENK